MSIQTICHVLGVNRSSFYAWKKRPESQRKKANLQLIDQLKAVHAESRGTYGAPRVTAELRSLGYTCGKNRVADLMRKEMLFGCARRKFRAISTTNSKHDLPLAARVFQVENQETHPKAPNEVWVSDSTYIPTQEGWLFLTIQLDVFTRKVVGYSMSDQLRSEAVWESLQQALQRQPEAINLDHPELIAHSDRGRQYASDLYRGKLKILGITPSMSRSGNCYDNAYAETFFHSLKVELVHRTQFKTRAQAKAEILDYIENWYNSKRRHSGLDYQSPNDYERQALAA